MVNMASDVVTDPASVARLLGGLRPALVLLLRGGHACLELGESRLRGEPGLLGFDAPFSLSDAPFSLGKDEIATFGVSREP